MYSFQFKLSVMIDPVTRFSKLKGDCDASSAVLLFSFSVMDANLSPLGQILLTEADGVAV